MWHLLKFKYNNEIDGFPLLSLHTFNSESLCNYHRVKYIKIIILALYAKKYYIAN